MPKISKTAYAGTELYDNGELSSIALEELASAAGYSDFGDLVDSLDGGTPFNARKFGTYVVNFCGFDWWPVQLSKSGGNIVLTLWLKTFIGNYTFSDGTYGSNTEYASNDYRYSWIRSAINMGQTPAPDNGSYYGSWGNSTGSTSAPTKYDKDTPSASGKVIAPIEFTTFSSIISNPFIIPGGDYGDYLWLPSTAEAASGGSWGCTTTQWADNGSTDYCWTRSPHLSYYYHAYYLYKSGYTDTYFSVGTNPYGVRPAINVKLGEVDNFAPDKPTEDTTTFTYNGSVQTYNPVGFDEETMQITGNKQTNAGNYTVTVSPIDGTWSDGDTEPVKFNFTINKATPTFILGNIEDSYETTSGLPENIYTFSTNGTFKWTTDTPTAGTNDYSWTFTPTDSLNYETVSDKISLTFTEPVVEPDPDNPDPDNPDPDNPDPDNPDPDNPDPDNPDPDNPSGGSGSGSTGGDNTDDNDPNNPSGSGSGSGSTDGGTDDNDPNYPGGSGSGSGSTGGDNTDDNDPNNPGGSGSGSGSTGGDNTDDNDPNNPGGSGSGSGSIDGDNTDDNDPNNPDGSGTTDPNDPNNPDNNDGNDDVNGGGSTDSDNNSKENNSNGAGATEMLNKIKDFMSKPVAGLALWLWILIAIAALIMLIIIIAIAKKHSKNKEQREEIKARKAEEKARRDEERQRREEERKLQKEKLDAERELARARQEAELEKIRAQAGLGMAGMGAASMAMQQPMQQQMPVQQQQPMQQPVQMPVPQQQYVQQQPQVQYVQQPMQMPMAMPQQMPMPQTGGGSDMLALMQAQLAEMRAEQNSAIKTELEIMKLRMEQKQQPQQYAQGNNGQNGFAPDGDMEKIGALAVAIWRNMQAQQNAEAKPAPAEEVEKTYPDNAVITTTTTVDTTKNKSVARSREKQSEFTDVDGFYDDYN